MTIGIAVIGAGMAGRAHAAAYRTAPTLYESVLPPLRFVSIGDVSPEFGAWPRGASATSARHLLAGDRGGPRHRRRQRGGGQLPAPRDGRGPAGRRQARAVREAAERHPGGRSRHGRGRPQRRHRGPDRLHLPPGARRRRAARAGHVRRRWARSCTSTPATGATTPADPQGPMSWRYKGAPGLRCARRHRQPRRVPGGVPRRRHHRGERRPVHHRDHRASGAARRRSSGTATPRSATRTSRSRTTTTPASAPGSRTAPGSSRSPGSPPVTRTAWPSRCSATSGAATGRRSDRPSSS